MAEYLDQKMVFHVMERASFPYLEGYLAPKITQKSDWSVVIGLDRVTCTWETGEVYYIDPHEYVRRENQLEVIVVHGKVLALIVSGYFSRADAEAAYRYYRASPESAAPSLRCTAASPALTGLEDIYGGNSNDDWEVNADGGGGVTSGRWKALRFKFDRYRHLLLEEDKFRVLVPSIVCWNILLSVRAQAGRHSLPYLVI